MKKMLFLLAITISIAACNKTVKNKTEASDAKAVATGTGDLLVVDTTQSAIDWIGAKVGGKHNGTLTLSKGELSIVGEEVTAGNFVIDMNSIVNKDLADKATNEMLVGHLKSPDFFDVAEYPSSVFTITSVEKASVDSITHLVSGNLQLKDVEKNITFGANITKEGDVYQAITVPFTIDRTQWNVQYGSRTLFANLKDNIVDDYIELQIKIVATAEN